MKILKSSERKRIMKQLEIQYGIKDFPYLLLKFGKEKLRIYSGNLSKDELIKLDKEFRIETIGMYFGVEMNNEIRLSFDVVSLFKNQIDKNIIDVDEKQAKEWLSGEDLIIESDKGFKIIRNNEDLVGCGKSTGEKIINYVPKERRILR